MLCGCGSGNGGFSIHFHPEIITISIIVWQLTIVRFRITSLDIDSHHYHNDDTSSPHNDEMSLYSYGARLFSYARSIEIVVRTI